MAKANTFLLKLAIFWFSLSAQAAPLITAPYVDLTRYVGLWYEIASIPQYFQRNCLSDTTAEYEALAKNRIKVVNSCTTAERKRITSEGRAKVVDAKTNARLKVTFAHLGDKYFYSFGGKYWITYLDPNYRYAIVGHPNREYGWILARDPMVPEKNLHELVAELRMRGYDSCQFLVTPQKNGFLTRSRLCDVTNVDTLDRDL